MPETQEIFHRHETNPILRKEHWPRMVNAVFNPGAAIRSRSIVRDQIAFQTPTAQPPNLGALCGS